MGRVLRSRGESNKGNHENACSNHAVNKSNLKVSCNSSKRDKGVLSDRTNVNPNISGKVKGGETLKLCDSVDKKRADPKKRNAKNRVTNQETYVLRKRKEADCGSPRLAKTTQLPPKGMVESNKVKARSKCFNNLAPKEVLLNLKTRTTANKTDEDQGFLGFDKAEKSPMLDELKKKIDLFTTKPLPTNSSKVNHLPIYRTNKPSPKMTSNNLKDRLHMYDFEIDENEPVVKKNKRKPILKIKRCRTYNKKKKAPSIPLATSNSVPLNQENICPIIHTLVESPKGYTPLSPVAERSTEEPLEKSIDDIPLDTSIESGLSARQNSVYSPPPYQSPRRDSLSVPIIRTSVSQSDEFRCNKALNKSVSSSKHDISMSSAYSANFNSPMYLGSSTPIHRHWVDQSANAYSNIASYACEVFDISNNFGFDDVDIVEEPIISPIKSFETPSRPVTPKKPSPIKVPHREVVRMLRFGPDAKDNTCEDDSLPTEELPANFFHDGDSPNFSPLSSPATPVVKKGNKHNGKHVTKKKQVVIANDLEDSDFGTQSSDEKASQEDERKLKNNHTSDRITRSNQTLSKTLKSKETFMTTRTTRRNACQDESDIDKDNGYETEISPNKQVTFVDVTKQPRRSYERPLYLRPRKFGRNESELTDDEEGVSEIQEEEVLEKRRTQPKKKTARSKKEEMELEKWAKAFNEQCMQVESFNLVVE